MSRGDSVFTYFCWQDVASAAHQAQRPAFNRKVRQEVGYLSTSKSLDGVAESSEVTPEAWEQTRRQALARSREVRMKMQDMRSGSV